MRNNYCDITGYKTVTYLHPPLGMDLLESALTSLTLNSCLLASAPAW